MSTRALSRVNKSTVPELPELPLPLIYLIVKLLLHSLTSPDLVVEAALQLISVIDLIIEPLLRAVVASCGAGPAPVTPIASDLNNGYFINDLNIILQRIEAFDWR
ncbi:hypothetical protein LX32DRAFT_293868 [Colletotrichum zoysiae]|uniref:Uncharacterized protein n=1 Tax=Colletotrichum zoysiae TaxID=1216348 RepID=A0AAD9HN02_9PEZI|nr:hypothetical protein LX32DRAFT_293868 [Colletotrichum zoysiae]